MKVRKRIVYFAVRDEVAVRELFAILLNEGVFPYRIIKSHAPVKPEFPDWVFRNLDTDKIVLADAKEIAQENSALLDYIERGVTVIVCWYNALSKEFIDAHGLTVHEIRDYFHEPMSYFEDVIFPIIKTKIEEELSDVNVTWRGKVYSKEDEEHRNLYEFSVSRTEDELLHFFYLYCDENGLARYEELFAEQAMKHPEETAQIMADNIIKELRVHARDSDN